MATKCLENPAMTYLRMNYRSTKKKVNYLETLSIQEGLEKLRLQSARELNNGQKVMAPDYAQHSTTHPEIAELLSRPAKFNPKPKAAHFVYNRSLGESSRGPAGPPPPASWTHHQRCNVSRTKPDSESSKQQIAHQPHPDVSLPPKKSLLHYMLLEISCDMRNHCRYNVFNLPSLSVRLKQLLLSYVAQYKPQHMTQHSFQTLFPLPVSYQNKLHLQDFGAHEDDVRMLDLRGLPLDSNFWDVAHFSSELEEDSSEATLPDRRFPLLSHLAVRHDSLPLDEFLLRAPLSLTHLSIAYSSIPIDLPTLSKTLVSITWLDLSGCNWLLAHNRWHNIQFDRGWRTVVQVVMQDVAFILPEKSRISEQDRINRQRGPSRLCTLEIITDSKE